MQGRHGRERPVAVVRLDADVVGLGHGRDLLRFEYSAGVHDVGLDQVHGLEREELREVELGQQAFARGDGDVDVVRDLLQGFQVLGRDGLLEVERAVLLHAVAHADRVGRREAAVDFDQQFDVVAHGFAHGPHLLERQVLGPPVDVDAAVFEGVALERGQAPFDVPHGVPDRGLGRRAVPAAVGPDPVPHLASEQLVDGGVEGAALDVPERDLDPADRRHLHDAAAHVEVVVERLPVPLDLHGIPAHEKLAELVDHRRHRERPARRLAPAGDAGVGFDAHEHEIARDARAERRRRRDGLDRGDLHGLLSACGRRAYGAQEPVAPGVADVRPPRSLTGLRRGAGREDAGGLNVNDRVARP